MPANPACCSRFIYTSEFLDLFKVLIHRFDAVIAEVLALGGADVADGITTDGSFLDGVAETFFGHAGQLAKFFGLQPFGLAGGSLQGFELLFDPIDSINEVDQQLCFHSESGYFTQHTAAEWVWLGSRPDSDQSL